MRRNEKEPGVEGRASSGECGPRIAAPCPFDAPRTGNHTPCLRRSQQPGDRRPRGSQRADGEEAPPRYFSEARGAKPQPLDGVDRIRGRGEVVERQPETPRLPKPPPCRKGYFSYTTTAALGRDHSVAVFTKARTDHSRQFNRRNNKIQQEEQQNESTLLAR